jgi:hypothetical protein
MRRLVEAGVVIEYVAARPKSETEIAAFLNTKIAAIKAEAQAQIVELTAGTREADLTSALVKQMNMLARSTELLHIGRDNHTPAERAEVEQMLGTWARIKAIRAASNEKEAEVLALSAADLKAAAIYDASVGWPK